MSSPLLRVGGGSTSLLSLPPLLKRLLRAMFGRIEKLGMEEPRTTLRKNPGTR